MVSNVQEYFQALGDFAFEQSLWCHSSVPTVLLMVDIDHFKRINDTYGHPGGDKVLQVFSDALTRTFRRRGDFICRYGGEEFACVARDLRNTDASKLADYLLSSVRNLVIPYQDREIRLTASVGFTALRAGESADAFVTRADAGLYEAKQSGRNRSVEL